MTRAGLPLVFLSAAAWVALAVHRRREPEGESRRRFAVALGLGGLLAHLGWAALHADRVRADPAALLSPAGACVLFVPAGLLVAAPWRAPAALRARFLGSAFASLPLALATARLGCLLAGCCAGIPTDLPWGLRLAGDPIPRHPTALYEIAGLALLHVLARGLPSERVAPHVLIGLGVLRLAIDPLRAPPPLGAPVVPPGALAALWIAAGRAIRAAPSGGAPWRRARRRRPDPAAARRSGGSARRGCRASGGSAG